MCAWKVGVDATRDIRPCRPYSFKPPHIVLIAVIDQALMESKQLTMVNILIPCDRSFDERMRFPN